MLFAGVCDYEKSTGTIRCYRYPLIGRGVIDKQSKKDKNA